MQRGRLHLLDGAIYDCDYRFDGDDRGDLNLGGAFTAHRERVDATLELADGERRSVAVSFGARVGRATFVCT